VIKQDISENQARHVLLAIGSNIGNRKLNIENAKFLISKNNNKIIKSSSYYETESWPNKKFPNYVNVVIKIQTYLKPVLLLQKLKLIEIKLGRKNNFKNYPRTCDIDIIDYDNQIINLNWSANSLEIPHPRLQYRNFVLLPLFEISKNWKHPKLNLKITDLLDKIGINNLRSIKLI